MLWCGSLCSESIDNFVKTEFMVCEFAITNSQPKRKRKVDGAYFKVISSHTPAQPAYVELYYSNIAGDWPPRAVTEADLQTWERLQNQSWGEARKRKVVWKQNYKTEEGHSLEDATAFPAIFC